MMRSDITYLDLSNGYRHAYLTCITDEYSHRIVGYHVACRMRVQEILKALWVAVQKELPQGQQHFDHKLIVHTDRGGQFKSERYVAFTDQYRIQRSMTSGGRNHENPVAERINGIIKHELLEPTSFRNLEQAREAILGIDPTP